AQKIGKSAINVENIVLSNPVIPGVALENKVVGTVFGLQPNTPSKSIEGVQGVYAVQVDSFVNPKELVDSELRAQQKQMLTGKQQRSWSAVFQALQNTAKNDDNRIKFYYEFIVIFLADLIYSSTFYIVVSMEIQENIVNKVAQSGLLTLHLPTYAPPPEIIEHPINDNLFHGQRLQETDFRDFA